MRKINPLKINQVRLQDSFWSQRVQLLRETILPYQWKALNDQIDGVKKSGSIHNFKIAAGEKEGSYHGFVFQDSDLYKWLEAVGLIRMNGLLIPQACTC